MNWTKILLPTDFSAHSYEGLRVAEMLAHQSSAELLIVHIVDASRSRKQEDWPDTEAATRDLEKWLLEPTPPSRGLTVAHALLEGNTAEEIVRFARQRKIDLIVMGSHGRTGIPRALMGSVTTQVLHHAPCDVLTVRPRARSHGDTYAWAHRKHELHSSSSI